MSATPLSYLSAAGERSQAILPLTWFTLIVSIVVCCVIAGLVWGGVRRASARGGAEETRATPVERGPLGNRWIGIGVLISAVPLLVTLVWTMAALAKVSGPPRSQAMTLDVSARQWWWSIQYDAGNPADTFTTANEIHVPVGRRVLVRLHGSDVIHSFWVPQLTGKTDMIPGQTNTSWIQAQAPGRYLGQCGEYCGFQHARMQFAVIAQSQPDFARWRAQQLAPARPPDGDAQTRGLHLVEYRCGLCHQVRGTSAGAVSAPDLTHIAGRQMLAAEVLPNNPHNLGEWIQHPQAFKRGSLMPAQLLTPSQLSDVVAYLETLQ